MDIFEKIKSNKGALGKYQEQVHGYFAFPKLEGEIEPHMKFRGKEVLTWSINNYLGLANHPDIRKTDTAATEKWGLAYPMGARMMSGQTSLHEEFERKAAEFVQKEAAYLLNYGYQGMVSIIDCLVDRHDVVIYDSEGHACINDGVRLHAGRRFVFPHNNMEKFRMFLQRATKLIDGTPGGILVIVEGVYGMIGDLSKLDEIVALKKEFNFRLLVDDAHGFGGMGESGRGTGEHFGVQNEIDIYFTTFAKSMAGIGAFVASTEDVINYLMYNMRSQVYAKSLPMPFVEGALKRLEYLITKPELRERLWTIINALQSGLKKANFDIGATQSPVTPVYIKSGSEWEAANFVLDLRENYNIFCTAVVYPIVAKGVVLLRLIPTATHTLEDVNYTINAFSICRDKLFSGGYDNTKVSINF
ncbi:MAG: aminotransferase class I/II-fold pyridoxal phosphate-dependent enzyme [Bacteroidota bacterium]